MSYPFVELDVLSREQKDVIIGLVSSRGLLEWFCAIRDRRRSAGLTTAEAWASSYAQVAEGIYPSGGCECGLSPEQHAFGMTEAGVVPCGPDRPAASKGSRLSMLRRSVLAYIGRPVQPIVAPERKERARKAPRAPVDHAGVAGDHPVVPTRKGGVPSRSDDAAGRGSSVSGVGAAPAGSESLDYPDGLPPVDAVGAALPFFQPQPSEDARTYAQDVNWVAEHLHTDWEVMRFEAPNPRAWAMLQWALSSPAAQQAFWTGVHARVSRETDDQKSRAGVLSAEDRRIDRMMVERLVEIGYQASNPVSGTTAIVSPQPALRPEGQSAMTADDRMAADEATELERAAQASELVPADDGEGGGGG